MTARNYWNLHIKSVFSVLDLMLIKSAEMWKTSVLLIYARVPRSFCEILIGGLLHFFLSRLIIIIIIKFLVNCTYAIIALTGRGRGYVRWSCLVAALAHHSWQEWCEEVGKANLPFFIERTAITWFFLFLLKACCFLSVILMKWKNPRADFVLWWRWGKFLTAITGKVVILIKSSSAISCCICGLLQLFLWQMLQVI